MYYFEINERKIMNTLKELKKLFLNKENPFQIFA